jgi:hypothetical protein
MEKAPSNLERSEGVSCSRRGVDIMTRNFAATAHLEGEVVSASGGYSYPRFYARTVAGIGREPKPSTDYLPGLVAMAGIIQATF